MLNAIRNFFLPPVFDDKEKSRNARILNIILWAVILLLFTLRIVSVSGDRNWVQRLLNPISILIVILALLIFVMKQGYIKQTSFVLLITSWAALTFQAYSYSGIYDVAYVGSIILILLAGLLLDFRYVILFACLSIVSGWGLAYYQTSSGLSINLDKPLSLARDYTVVFLLLTLITYLIISGFRNAAANARENEQRQIQTNIQLQELQTSLEERVEARTHELQETFALLGKRAKELEAVSEISHSMTSIQDIDELLPSITILISSRYGFYHTGIYLIDDTRKYAVLRAASSEIGQRLLEKQQKLRVEPTSMVGFAASSGQIRVAADVTKDINYMAISDLPDTKSEVVIPLVVGSEIIGVLDVESTELNAFSEREISILHTLANLAAVSIQNARSFSETRRALAESERIYKQFVQQGWGRIARNKSILGYKYSLEGLMPITIAPKANAASQSQILPASDPKDQPAVLSIPIKLRDQVIGTMRVQSTKPLREWDQDELAMIQATADRAALALENARLLEDSQRRATKERVISEIAAKITGSISMDNILKTAVEELGQAIPSAEVVVQFQNPEAEN